MQVTPDLLRELEELYQASGTDEWSLSNHKYHDWNGGVHRAIRDDKGNFDLDVTERVSIFAVAAHNAIPALLQYIRELENRVALLECEDNIDDT